MLASSKYYKIIVHKCNRTKINIGTRHRISILCTWLRFAYIVVIGGCYKVSNNTANETNW
jgi:uncharacterized metal-binding protein